MSDLSKVKSSDLSTRSYSPLFRLRLQMECSYIALLREFCYVENLSTSIIFSVIFFQRKKSQLILSHVEVQIKQFKTLNWNTWKRHVCISCHDLYQSVLTSVQCLPGVCHGPRLLSLPVQPPLPPPRRPGWCWLLLPDKSGSGQRQPGRDLQPLHWSGLFPAILHVNIIILSLFFVT